MVTRRGASRKEGECKSGRSGQEASGGLSDRLRGARIGSLTTTERDFVAAYLVGLRRSSRILVDSRVFDTSAERSDDSLVLETAIGARIPCRVRAVVVHSGVKVRLEDSLEERALFMRRLLSSFGARWDPLVREERALERIAPEDRARERIAPGQLRLSGLCEGVGKAFCLEKLGRIGAVLPYLVNYLSASEQLSYLLPPQEAQRVLVWCAREGVGPEAFATRGGWRLLDESLAPLMDARGRSLMAVLGTEGMIAFVKKILLVAHDAGRSGEPDRLVGRKLRNAFRSAFSVDGGGPLTALAELAEILEEEVRELVGLSRAAGRPDGARTNSCRRRLETLCERGDLVARRLVRAARSARSSAGLEAAAREVESARGLLLEIARAPSFPPSGLDRRVERGLLEAAFGRQLDRTVTAAQSFLRAVLSSKDRSASSHAEIGCQLQALRALARLSRDEARAAIPGSTEDTAQPSSSEQGFSRLVCRLGEACRHLQKACEELFEYSLECSSREVEELT